jgi:small subunit ribosomal protein S21
MAIKDRLLWRDGCEVKVINGDIDRAAKLLRRRTEAAGIFKVLRDRKKFVKPCEKRREKQRRAAARRLKAEQRKQRAKANA